MGDYGALSAENVALRARVNKTTLCRRWPTKAALVHAALDSIVDEVELGTSTGSLRADCWPTAERWGGMIHVRLFVKKMRIDDLMLTRAVDTLVGGIGVTPRA